MSKMQPVDFHDVEDFLSFLPKNEREIVLRLRQIIFECIPDAEEKLAYNVPFYYRHSRIGYIWPSSVPWGKVSHAGVHLGFEHGNLLKDETGYLNRGKRKQIYWKDFHSVKEIDVDLLKSFLFEAAMVDEKLFREKMRLREKHGSFSGKKLSRSGAKARRHED